MNILYIEDKKIITLTQSLMLHRSHICLSLLVPSGLDTTLTYVNISNTTFKLGIYLYQIKIINDLDLSFDSTVFNAI